MQTSCPRDDRTRGPAIDKVSLPCTACRVIQVSLVSSGAEIQCPIGNDLVDGLCDETVLEGRFVEIADVINDDITSCGAQIENVLRELRLAQKCSGKKELRVRRKIVHNLEHRRALAACSDSQAALTGK